MSTRPVTALFFLLVLAIAGFWLGFVMRLVRLRSESPVNGQLLMVEIDDVGDGDAAYVSAPGLSLLIDSGPDEASAAHVIAQMHRMSRAAPHAIILTNTHPDSIGGVSFLLSHYGFRCPIILPCSKMEFAQRGGLLGEELIDRATLDHIPLYTADQVASNPAVSKLLTANTPSTACQVTLVPVAQAGMPTSTYALRIDYNEGSLLYTAGLTPTDEDQLIAQRVNLNCDVLAAASGTGDSALSSEFLALSQPSVVTLSNSQESPPSDQVLGRLRASDAMVARTDLSGTVTLGISADPSTPPRFFGENAILPRQYAYDATQ